MNTTVRFLGDLRKTRIRLNTHGHVTVHVAPAYIQEAAFKDGDRVELVCDDDIEDQVLVVLAQYVSGRGRKLYVRQDGWGRFQYTPLPELVKHLFANADSKVYVPTDVSIRSAPDGKRMISLKCPGVKNSLEDITARSVAAEEGEESLPDGDEHTGDESPEVTLPAPESQGVSDDNELLEIEDEISDAPQHDTEKESLSRGEELRQELSS